MDYLLTSARLGFRPWREVDAPLAIGLWTDADVMRHMGGPHDEAGALERMRLEMTRQEELGFSYWAMFLVETGEHVGCAGLRPFHDEAGVLELGAHMRRKFWSGRFGEEAARAVIAYGFDVVGVSALVGGTGPDNLNSQALLGRLGFRFTHVEPWGRYGVMHPYYRLEAGSR